MKVTLGGKDILNLSYTYDEVSNIKTITDGGKIKTFEYNKNNQLTKTITPGTFMEPTPTPGMMALKTGDTLGNGVFEFAPILSGLMGLDYHASSIGIDFGLVAPGVKRIELVPDKQYSTHRINENTIALYVSSDNINYTLIPRTNWEYQKDSKGIVTLTLKDKLATRYLKLHVKYDERGRSFEPVNKATFLNEVAKMLRVYQEASSRTEEYQYDAAGNRKLLRVTLARTLDYNSQYYTNSNRLKTDGKYAFAYDKAGNMVKKGNTYKISGDTVNFKTSGEDVEYWEYRYDLLNRLISVTKNGTIVSEYTYDPEGLRVVKKAKGETTHYVFEGTEPLFEKKISTGKIKSYVYALGKYLARVDGVIGDTEAKKYFYHTDHTGSIRVITDQAGKVVFNADYLAFGTQFGKDGDFEELHGFTGKEYDPDIGLYYFNARWYDPDLGRFISEDPAADPNNPNLYSYCGNNPVMRTDPTGKWWQIIVYAVIGGINAQRNGGDFWTGAYVGAISGALSWGIGEGLGAVGMAEGALSTNIVSGALASGIMSETMGGDFMDGAKEGALSGLISWGVGKGLEKWGNKNKVNKYIVKGIDKGLNARARGERVEPLTLIFDMFDIWEIFKGMVRGKDNTDTHEAEYSPDLVKVDVDYVIHPAGGGGPLLDSTIVDDFNKAVNELKADGIDLTFEDMFRAQSKVDHFVNIIEKGDTKGKVYHGIYKVSKTSPHSYGRGFDVRGINSDNINSERSQKIINTFKKYNFKWEGENDPVHFTAIQPSVFKTRQEAIAHFQTIWKVKWERIYGSYNCTAH